MNIRIALAVAAVVAWSAPAAAQSPADSAAARPAPPQRAAWLSDRTPLRVGDIVTVVVDEQTAARERVSRVASAERSQRNRLDAIFDADAVIGRSDIASGVDNRSRDVGDAGRTGDLTAVMSVRVVELAANGVARLQGARTVTVDGRPQEITLQGWVRSEDIRHDRVVLSSRIADAVITYKGKTIGPRAGIFGKILSILWP